VEDQVSVFISARNKVAQLHTRALGSSLVSSEGYCIINPRYIVSAWPSQKTMFLLLPVLLLRGGICAQNLFPGTWSYSCYLVIGLYIPVFVQCQI
jgi:hypothetical protein